jgi:hypothetical protein
MGNITLGLDMALTLFHAGAGGDPMGKHRETHASIATWVPREIRDDLIRLARKEGKTASDALREAVDMWVSARRRASDP